MTKLFVVGLSHHTAPLDVREKLSVSQEATPTALARLLEGPAQEIVLLSTCNRVEVYGSALDPGQAVAYVRNHLAAHLPDSVGATLLYERLGEDAVRHVFRVAASLDSMVVGEPQILGQVKAAFHTAEASGTVGQIIARCFRQAFAVAKRVRSETGIAKGSVSVSSIAIELAAKIFGQLTGRVAVLIGAGEMAESAAKNLRQRGAQLVVINRNPERAQRLADAVGGTPRAYEQLFLELVQADVVVSSTASPTPIIDERLMREVVRARRGRALFLIDIAVPRDVDPRCGGLQNVYLYDVDDLQRVAAENVAARVREADRAEQLVAAEVQAFEKWRRSLSLKPTIVALRSHFHELATKELEKTIARLSSVSDQDRQSLERMTESLVSKLLHQPLSELKGSVDQRDAALLIEAAQRLFALPIPEPMASVPPKVNQVREQSSADDVSDDSSEESGTALQAALKPVGVRGQGQ